MEFKDNTPIYLQIEEVINNRIISEEYKIGEKIPSVRELSLDLGVNINTVQKSLNELVDEGILITQRGRGNFVTDDLKVILKIKQELVNNIINEMYDKLSNMGLSKSEIVDAVTEFLKGRKE